MQLNPLKNQPQLKSAIEASELFGEGIIPHIIKNRSKSVHWRRFSPKIKSVIDASEFFGEGITPHIIKNRSKSINCRI